LYAASFAHQYLRWFACISPHLVLAALLHVEQQGGTCAA
jgi:hypothetical protein